MLEKLKSSLIVSITKRPNIFPLVQWVRRKNASFFCSSNTDLVIEGFDSSANSFIVNIFRMLDSEINISHHTHSVANMKRARYYKVPTIVLYRDPEDAIPSSVSRFRPSLEEALHRYICFYRYALQVQEEVELVSFETATSRFEDAVRRVEEGTPLSFDEFDRAALEERVVTHIQDWSKRHGKEQEKALPSEERERRKKHLRASLQSMPKLEEARSLFQALEEASSRKQ
jgi:hypothetical protein